MMKAKNGKRMYDRAEAVFKKIENSLMPIHKGEIVFVEPDSGDYVCGVDEVKVAIKALKRHPKKKFGIFRVGYRAVHKVMKSGHLW